MVLITVLRSRHVLIALGVLPATVTQAIQEMAIFVPILMNAQLTCTTVTSMLPVQTSKPASTALVIEALPAMVPAALMKMSVQLRLMTAVPTLTAATQ